MSNTYRKSLAFVQDGKHVMFSRYHDHRKFVSNPDRRKRDRREHHKIEREAVREYYVDLLDDYQELLEMIGLDDYSYVDDYGLDPRDYDYKHDYYEDFYDDCGKTLCDISEQIETRKRLISHF